MSNLLIPGIFAAGCIAGILLSGLDFTLPDMHGISLYVLYALMLQVGFSIGCGDDCSRILRTMRPKHLLIPAATIAGTLTFSAAVGLLLSQWSVQLKTPSIGLQLATELGTIALLANIFRELFALMGAPLFRRYFGKLAPISAAGVTSVDVALPTIMRTSGSEMVPIAIFHGLLIDISVPFFISLFCNL